MHFVGSTAALISTSVFLLGSGCRRQGAGAPAVAASPAPVEMPATPAVAWSQDPVASASVPSGELAGVVLDAETGAPLAMVQVWRPNQALPVVSDSAGRFRISAPNAAGTLRVVRIGYDPYRITLPRSDSGLIAVIALHPSAVITCHVSSGTAFYEVDSKGRRRLITRVERHPGVVVIARDALTARAPAGGVTVSVHDGTFADSAAARADTSERVVVSAAFERPGRYDIVVRSPGYRDWTGASVARTISECGGELRPAVFHAWLLPR